MVETKSAGEIQKPQFLEIMRKEHQSTRRDY